MTSNVVSMNDYRFADDEQAWRESELRRCLREAGADVEVEFAAAEWRTHSVETPSLLVLFFDDDDCGELASDESDIAGAPPAAHPAPCRRRDQLCVLDASNEEALGG